MAERYLELLSEYDLRVLAQLNGWIDESSSTTAVQRALARFRERPMLISEMLETPGLYDQLVAMTSAEPSDTMAISASGLSDDVLVEPSELLSFAILVHGRCADLTRTSFVATRLGGRVYVPYLLDHDIMSFAGQPAHRLFLVELLGSFTSRRLTSGLTVSDDAGCTPTSEYDPIALVRLLDQVDEAEKVGLYRRLGDLALFRGGMFPTETANQFTDETDLMELLRSLPDRFQREDNLQALAASLAVGSNLELFAELGPIWYRMAARRSQWPLITAPLISMADNFDAAHQLLRQLSETSLVRDRRAMLFPSAA